MTIQRKPLLIILSALVLINIFTWGLRIIVKDSEITPHVYFIDRSGSTETVNKVTQMGLDPYFSEGEHQMNFIVVTKDDDNLVPLVDRFKVTGSQATIVTDGSGKKVLERFTKILTKEEMKAVAEKY